MQSYGITAEHGKDLPVFFCLVSTADGSPVTSGTPAAYVTQANNQSSPVLNTRTIATGAATHIGGGVWSLLLDSAELDTYFTAVDITLAGAESVFISVSVERGRTIDAIDVGDELTHVVEDYRSKTIIEVNQNFAGTIKLIPPDGITLSSVTSCNLTGAGSVTGTNMRRTPDHKAALVDFAALSTTGTYTATWTVETTDSQTLVYTGTLIVY